MKNTLRAIAAVILGASLSAFAMAADPAPLAPSSQTDNAPDGCAEVGGASCCPCGDGKICCVTIGPLQPVPKP